MLQLAGDVDEASVVERWTRTISDNFGVIDTLDVMSREGVRFRVFLLDSSLQVDLSFWPRALYVPRGRLPARLRPANEPTSAPQPSSERAVTPPAPAGRPWNFAAVLTVLRIRAHLGEVFFRTYHPAPHPPLVDTGVFDAAQQILIARGEDHAKRATNGSDYLLAGLITCTRCGARFVGGAAKGNRYRYRYRYYTCFTRHRYGTGSCDSDRLPAEELDRAVLDSLLDTYSQADLLQRALSGGRDRAGEQQRRLREELEVTEAELRKTEEAIERYLLAFEAGNLPEATCGQRVQTLAEKAAGLRDRRAELTLSLDAAAEEGPTEAELDALRSKIRDVIADGDTGAQKQLLYSLVHAVEASTQWKPAPAATSSRSSRFPTA